MPLEHVPTIAASIALATFLFRSRVQPLAILFALLPGIVSLSSALDLWFGTTNDVASTSGAWVLASVLIGLAIAKPQALTRDRDNHQGN